MARLDTLPDIERACWDQLGRAATERGHPWRTMTLATVDGSAADARTVILREADPSARVMRFYTDSRSPKVAQIAARPDGMLVAWSPRLSWQLRARVTIEVVDSGLDLSSRWAQVKLSPSAQDFLAALPPGTPVAGYQPERSTREHFAMLQATVTALDWLELHPDGHRRALLDGDRSAWLTP